MSMIITAFALLQASTTQAPAATPPAPPPPPCASEGHAGFDFWVGEWDVYPNGSERKVAESKIERLHNGCAVRESWMPASGNTGSSLNHYEPVTGRWFQKWVGSGGGSVEFEGGVTDGKMVLTGFWPAVGGPGRDGLIRMSYSTQDGGAVRQHGEVSYDHGLTWGPSFDFIYRPKAGKKETE